MPAIKIQKTLEQTLIDVQDFFSDINNLPENTPVYKDSGRWQLRSDSMKEVYIQQETNETFQSFIKRCADEYGS